LDGRGDPVTEVGDVPVDSAWAVAFQLDVLPAAPVYARFLV
jgi:hypothetical protein